MPVKSLENGILLGFHEIVGVMLWNLLLFCGDFLGFDRDLMNFLGDLNGDFMGPWAIKWFNGYGGDTVATTSQWKDPPFLMGKSTSSMAIESIAMLVCLPEGKLYEIRVYLNFTKLGVSLFGTILLGNPLDGKVARWLEGNDPSN